MMLYDFSTIDKLKKHQKKWIILDIILFLIGVGFLILFGLLSNYKNYLPYEICSIILFVGIGWVCFYILFNLIIDDYRTIQFLSNLRKSKFIVNVYKISLTNKTITLSRNVVASQINADINGTSIILYWNNKHGDCPLKNDCFYKITSGNNYILDYEEVKNVEQN